MGSVCTTLHLHAPYILTAPAHLLFLPFFVFSSAHGTGFVVVSPLDLLADTDDNEAGNETRTRVSIQLAEISMYLDYKLHASFRRVLESLSTLDATDDNPPRASPPKRSGSVEFTEKWALSAKPSSRG